MARDPYWNNAQAERQAGTPTWKPKVACSGCGLLTGTYSRIAGRPWCAVCGPDARKTLRNYGHIPSDERKP